MCADAGRPPKGAVRASLQVVPAASEMRIRADLLIVQAMSRGLPFRLLSAVFAVCMLHVGARDAFAAACPSHQPALAAIADAAQAMRTGDDAPHAHQSNHGSHHGSHHEAGKGHAGHASHDPAHHAGHSCDCCGTCRSASAVALVAAPADTPLASVGPASATAFTPDCAVAPFQRSDFFLPYPTAPPISLA